MTNFHIVSWNRPKMTELVIRTIVRNTLPGSYQIIVLDNGSDNETRAMLDRLRQGNFIQHLVLLDENKGLEAARQYLFHQFAGNEEYFVCVDNDCLVPPAVTGRFDWLMQLTDLMDKYEDYAAIACRTQVMIGTGNIFEDDSLDITEFPHPGGSFRIMRRKAVEAVNGWDRESFGRGAEERYIGQKLRDAGFKTGFATHIEVLHLFGTRGLDNRTDRWGYDQELKPEDTGHSDIWHPSLENGDDPDTVALYCGEKLTKEYFL